MSKKKDFIEIAYYKGNMNQDGAIFRLNEMNIILKAIAKQHDCAFQEDECSLALMISAVEGDELPEMTQRAKKEVLNYVDLCGYFSPDQIESKAQKLVDLANEKDIVLGVGLVRYKMGKWSMDHGYSERKWSL